jgi:hypothetical protein
MRSQAFLGSDHGFNSIVHVLDKLDFVSSESSEVGDIEDTVVSFGVLSVDTSDLYVIFVSDGLVEFLVVHQFWQVDVNRSSETSSHVGWAGGNVSEMLVIGEFCFLLNLVGTISKSSENLLDVGTLLHGDNSELILFVNPNEEGFGIVVEDTSSLWPVSLESSRLKIFVSSLEKEVIGDQLLSVGVRHVTERVVFTFKVTLEFTEGGDDKLLDFLSLGSGNVGTEWIGSQVSGNSDSSRVDHLVLVSWEGWAVKGVIVHGGDMFVRWLVAVIGLDDFVEEWGKGVVGVVRSSINTDTGVSPFRSGEDGLSEGETEFISSVLALIPDFLSKAFL